MLSLQTNKPTTWYGTLPEKLVSHQLILRNVIFNVYNNNNKNNNIIMKREHCVLTDVAISGDRNVIKIEAQKILKYKELAIEIERMWNVETKVIPVIIWATGIISKTFRKYVSNIPGNHEVKELQKTATLGTAHILQKVLM